MRQKLPLTWTFLAHEGRRIVRMQQREEIQDYCLFVEKEDTRPHLLHKPWSQSRTYGSLRSISASCCSHPDCSLGMCLSCLLNTPGY